MSGGDYIFWGITIIAGLGIVAFLMDYGYQQWVWNKGICRQSGLPWRELGRSREDITYSDIPLSSPKAHYCTVQYRSIDNADT